MKKRTKAKNVSTSEKYLRHYKNSIIITRDDIYIELFAAFKL